MTPALTDASAAAIMAVGGLAALIIVITAALRGWREWLDLKRAELAAADQTPSPVSPGTRIELADLKERVRRLEAIANGVES